MSSHRKKTQQLPKLNILNPKISTIDPSNKMWIIMALEFFLRFCCCFCWCCSLICNRSALNVSVYIIQFILQSKRVYIYLRYKHVIKYLHSVHRAVFFIFDLCVYWLNIYVRANRGDNNRNGILLLNIFHQNVKWLCQQLLLYRAVP